MSCLTKSNLMVKRYLDAMLGVLKREVKNDQAEMPRPRYALLDAR